MTKHTPGPWQAKIDECGNAAIFSGDECVADCLKRDARLVAAAPDLLEALENCEAFLLSAGFASSDVYAAVCAAIAKATGEQA